jgi:phytol kinase
MHLMIPLVCTVAAVLGVLLINEWWWRGKVHGEVSRKFVHITVGSFVAFWPLFLTWRQIELMSIGFVVVVAVSQKLHVFKTIHSVQRPTWGELFFAASVGLIAFVTHNPVVYAAALLHMSVADGLAAIVGVKYGASQAYRIFGATKSVAGSVTFAVVSVAILASFCLHQHVAFSPFIALLAVGATVLENVAVRGLDNLLIPVLVAWVLTNLS